MKHHRRLFVAASARSGTRYAAKMWQKLGLDVGHEYVGAGGTSSSPFVSPRVKYPAVPSRPPKGRCIHIGEHPSQFEFEHVVHQVRHPLKVVDSMRWTPAQVNYLTAYGVPASKTLLVRAVRICWLWNTLCGQIAETRYRIEDIDVELSRLCALVGVAFPGKVPSVARDTNHAWRYTAARNQLFQAGKRVPYKRVKEIVDTAPRVTWDMVLAVDRTYGPRLLAQAVEYGYGEENPW